MIARIVQTVKGFVKWRNTNENSTKKPRWEDSTGNRYGRAYFGGDGLKCVLRHQRSPLNAITLYPRGIHRQTKESFLSGFLTIFTFIAPLSRHTALVVRGSALND